LRRVESKAGSTQSRRFVPFNLVLLFQIKVLCSVSSEFVAEH
jgi:hypothetical protein